MARWDEELYRKCADDLTRFAAGLVGPGDAPDVVSTAFIACTTSRRWAGVRDRRAYLFRAVFNEAKRSRRSIARRRRREFTMFERTAVVLDEPTPEVVAAILGLSVRQRAVIVLTYWGDLDPASIARSLGISEGAVRRHLARARAHLRELLRDA